MHRGSRTQAKLQGEIHDRPRDRTGFSRTILADRVGTDETVQTIKAKPDECVKLAERLELNRWGT